MQKSISIVAVVTLFALPTAGCGSTIDWRVSTVVNGNPQRPNPDLLLPEDPPEAACARIAKGSTSHKSSDTTAGLLLGIVGAGGGATSGTLLAQGGHHPEYYGEWGLIAAGSVALAATGIYFLTRGGNDRSEFWAANAAVAQTRADYTVYGPDDGSVPAAKLRENLKTATDQRDTDQAALADRTAVLTEKQAVLKTVQDAATKRLTGSEPTDSAANGGKPAAPPPGGQAGPPKPAAPRVDDQAAANAAIKQVEDRAAAVSAAQKEVDEATRKLAGSTNAVALAQGALAARQAAWLHCVSALQTIGGIDSTANTALASAISAGLAPKSGSGDKSSGGDSSKAAGGDSGSGGSKGASTSTSGSDNK